MWFQPIWRCQNSPEDFIFKCHIYVSRNAWNEGHFSPLQDSQMHVGSKQGTLLKTTLFFQKAKLSLLKASNSILNVIYAFKITF